MAEKKKKSPVLRGREQGRKGALEFLDDGVAHCAAIVSAFSTLDKFWRGVDFHGRVAPVLYKALIEGLVEARKGGQ